MNKIDIYNCYICVQERINNSRFTLLRNYRNSKQDLFKLTTVFEVFTKQKTWS